MKTQNLTLHICRISLAFCWVYQGLVPKLLGPHPDELTIVKSIGFSGDTALRMVQGAGSLEVLFGLLLLIDYKRPLHYLLSGLAMIGLLITTLIFSAQFTVSAFNAVSCNLALGAISLIALIELKQHHP